MKNLAKPLLVLAVFIFASANLLVTGDSAFEADMKEGFVADWERAKAYSLEYLNAMPADGYSYQPNDDVRSFQAQFLHMAQGNLGLVGNATDGERLYADVQNFELEESMQGKENVIRITTEVYDWCIDQVKNMDMSKAHEVVGPNEQFSFERIEWLKKGFEHQTHHRGQTTIYLRMKGIAPPPEKLF